MAILDALCTYVCMHKQKKINFNIIYSYFNISYNNNLNKLSYDFYHFNRNELTNIWVMVYSEDK